MRRNVIALAKVAKAYDLPVVITTSADDGPNGAQLPESSALLPDAPVIRRPGEIDAFDNSDFAAAIKATGPANAIGRSGRVERIEQFEDLGGRLGSE